MRRMMGQADIDLWLKFLPKEKVCEMVLGELWDDHFDDDMRYYKRDTFRVLRDIWERRRVGLDPRWNRGIRGAGRLTRELEAEIKKEKETMDEQWREHRRVCWRGCMRDPDVWE